MCNPLALLTEMGEDRTVQLLILIYSFENESVIKANQKCVALYTMRS